MDRIEALVAGHICLDIIPELAGSMTFEPGRLIEAGPATLMTGGAVANTGQSLHKLGVNVHLVGKIGVGLFSDAVRQILETSGEGLSKGLIQSDEAPTSYTVVLNLTGQDRMFLHCPGCNAIFRSADVSDELLASVPLMHFGYPPIMEAMFADDGKELEDLFRRAKAQGCTTSLDLSLPDVNAASGKADWKAILTRVLPYVDLFLPSIEEVTFMLDRPTFDSLRGCRLSHLPESVFRRLAQRSHKLGAKIVAIKAGDRGCFLHSDSSLGNFGRAQPVNLDAWRGQEIWAPVFAVHARGTTGAGDATIAGLLMGLLHGMTAAEALSAGVAAGASCCEQPDAVSGVKSWPETSARIEAGWSTGDPELDSTWELTDGVYRKAMS